MRADPSTLLRVVARDGVVTADPSAVLPGRGAWVHPTPECVAASIKRKAFGRALRSSAALDTGQLQQTVLADNQAESQPGFPKEQAD